MEKSESENESDCYESAEEEFEKNEIVLKQNLPLVETIPENESDVVNSVNSDQDAENTVVEAPRKEARKSVVSYRKRPERVRRLDSVTSSKKEPLKTEICSPDAFLQDITMNFSKNINKSLNTIQQTSSSVKNLIKNSLPAATLSERRAFSYDDNENVPMDVDMDSELCDSSQNELNSNETSKCLAESKIEDGQNNKKCIEDKINNLSQISELNAKAQKHNSEKFVLNECNVPNAIENLKENSDIVKDAISKKPPESCVDENDEKESHVPLAESNLVSNELKSDNLEKEIKYDKHQNEEEEAVNETTSQIVKIIECKDPDLIEDEFCQSSTKSAVLSKDFETVSDSHNLSMSGILSEEEGKEHTTGINTALNQHESDDWNDSIPNPNNTEVVDSWIKGDWDDFSEDPAENKTQNLECDLAALKTSLERIVLQNEGESSTNESKKPEKTSSSEKLESTEARQDGWDDFEFDISDSELENVHAEVKEVEKPIPALTGQKIKPKNISEQEKEELAEKNINEERRDIIKEKVKGVSLTKKSISKKSILGAEKLEKTTTENVSKVEETKPDDNDNWNWDNWDDCAKKNTIFAKKEVSRNEGMQKDNEINEFEEKWPGWDKFAQKQDEKEGNWNLGSWGMNMLLNKASAVTQGLSTVLEAGLGAPDPETLARMEKEERLKTQGAECQELEKENSSRKNSNDALMFPVFELTSLVAGVTSKIVDSSKIQEIGSKVISGGLDTLESFGKKTMEVLQEGDPGLKKKRALLLGSNKPVLSQVLREAKEKAEKEDRRMEEKELFRKCQFETLFDDYQGMIHLEALEMLSTQCELKLEQMRSSLNPAEQEDMDGILQEVEQLCCLEDFYLDWDNFSNVDFRVSIELAVESLQEEISLVKILQIHGQVDQWLIDTVVSKPSAIVIHQKIVSTLAELTAATVHQFHKTGELLSVKERRKTVEEVDALLKMTNVLCAELERLCGRFMALCETMPEKDSIGEKIDIVLKNAVSYIKQAFHLLVPIIQVGAAM